MLSLFRNIAAIPVPLGEADQYHMSPDKIAEEIARGTSVILTSNPRNPTGQMVSNPEVSERLQIVIGFANIVTSSHKSKTSAVTAQL